MRRSSAPHVWRGCRGSSSKNHAAAQYASMSRRAIDLARDCSGQAGGRVGAVDQREAVQRCERTARGDVEDRAEGTILGILLSVRRADELSRADFEQLPGWTVAVGIVKFVQDRC